MLRITIELARGTPHGRDKEKWGYSSSRRSRSRERGRGGDRDRGGKRPIWLDKYGPPTRTDYRVLVENLSSRVSWQVRTSYGQKWLDVCLLNI